MKKVKSVCLFKKKNNQPLVKIVTIIHPVAELQHLTFCLVFQYHCIYLFIFGISTAYDTVQILLNLFDFNMILTDNVALTDLKSAKIKHYYIHKHVV